MYKELNGDLIELALAGEFDVIAHGCNCFNTMGAGIALRMKETFHCHKFKYEQESFKGDINKLGTIDYATLIINPETGNVARESFAKVLFPNKYITVINAYTQYHYGKAYATDSDHPVNYAALSLCMKKINHTFKGKHIGLPKVGATLGGGDWEIIKQIIIKELKDCDVTVVLYNK